MVENKFKIGQIVKADSDVGSDTGTIVSIRQHLFKKDKAVYHINGIESGFDGDRLTLVKPKKKVAKYLYRYGQLISESTTYHTNDSEFQTQYGSFSKIIKRLEEIEVDDE